MMRDFVFVLLLFSIGTALIGINLAIDRNTAALEAIGRAL